MSRRSIKKRPKSDKKRKLVTENSVYEFAAKTIGESAISVILREKI